MTKSWPVRVAVLMAVTAVAGVMAVHATPPGGRGIGIWPVGLATASLLPIVV